MFNFNRSTGIPNLIIWKKSLKFFIRFGLILNLLVSKEMPVQPMNGRSPMRYELRSKCKHFELNHLFISVISPLIKYLFFRNNLKQASVGEPSFLRLRTTLNMFFQWKLSLRGNIEINPGPLINYKYLTTLFKTNNRSLKFFHLNAQSLLKKRSTLENLINDLGANIIFGFSESWLKTSDDKKLWQINPTHFKTFRTDREEPNREKGGGVMLIIPACLNPKTRDDLNYLNKNFLRASGSNAA